MAELLGQIFLTGLLIGSVYALLSIGLTLVFGVLRVVNFAHGDFLTLSMYLTFFLFQLWKKPAYVLVPFVAVIMFLFGLLIYKLVINKIIGAPAVAQVFATVGLSIALQNSALVLWTGDFRTIRSPYSDAVVKLGEISLSLPLVVAFFVATVATLLLFLFLRFTYFGKAIRALVQDRDAARAVGINVERVYLLTFALGAACAGVAGALLAPLFPIFPTVGISLGLVAFVVVVLGGMGSMTGALVAGFIVGIVEAFSGFFLAPALKEVVYFLVFILVLLVRPQGLFGLLGAEKLG